VQSLSWSPEVSGIFTNNTSYTAAIVLKAAAGHKFTGTINPTTDSSGTPSTGIIDGGNTAGNTLSFTVSFPATTADISSVSISGLTAPVTGATPVTAGALSPGASTYSVQSLSWSPPASGTFDNNISYTAAIVLKAGEGYKFTGTITPDTGGAGTPSVGTIGDGDITENTLSFTVSFPATLIHIGSTSVSGLAAPVTGAAPVILADLNAGDINYTAQSLSWSPPASGTFANDISYTATIVLKAAAGYKFAGTITPTTGGVGTPMAGTINGDIAENTLTFAVSFPATIVSVGSASISGLTAPVTGATPTEAGALSPGASTYSAQSLSWSPTVSGTFTGGVSYTATVELKAASGHKFAGTITPDTGGVGAPSAGTIGGGDAAENTLSFTVSFPVTIISVGSASISGLTAPITGVTPTEVGALSSGASTYSVQSLSWSPTVSGTFAGGVSYTATVELKAAPGHKFIGTIIPGTGGVGTPSTGIIGGGDVAENTLSFTVSFPPTANTGIPIGDPSMKLYLNGGATALEQNGITSVGSAGAGIYTVSIAPDTYTDIKWYLNGILAAQGSAKIAISLSMQNTGTFKVTVEAEPQGGSKNTGTHTFVVN
jgi:hypothetical protein